MKQAALIVAGIVVAVGANYVRTELAAPAVQVAATAPRVTPAPTSTPAPSRPSSARTPAPPAPALALVPAPRVQPIEAATDAETAHEIDTMLLDKLMEVPDASRERAIAALPFSSDNPAIVRFTIRRAFVAARGDLGACYAAALPSLGENGELAVRAHVSLVADGANATRITTAALVDDPALDGCLRNVIDSLALPPLPAGDRIELDYPLVFTQAV